MSGNAAFVNINEKSKLAFYIMFKDQISDLFKSKL